MSDFNKNNLLCRFYFFFIFIYFYLFLFFLFFKIRINDARVFPNSVSRECECLSCHSEVKTFSSRFLSFSPAFAFLPSFLLPYSLSLLDCYGALHTWNRMGLTSLLHFCILLGLMNRVERERLFCLTCRERCLLEFLIHVNHIRTLQDRIRTLESERQSLSRILSRIRRLSRSDFVASNGKS